MKGHTAINKWIHSMVFIVLLAMAYSCGNKVPFQKQTDIPSEGWHFRHEVLFEIPISDTLSLHELYLDVRNNTSYPYQNLFLFLDIEFPDGQALRDTIECILADRSGRWTGKGFGALRFNRFLFRDDVWFPEAGIYRFRIHQAMREDMLEGITDVGLRVEKK